MTARSRRPSPPKRVARSKASRIPPASPKGPVIGVAGLGYVGLASALALTHYGRTVVGFDVVEARRKDVARGVVPLYDEGLATELTQSLRSHRLSVVDSVEDLVRAADLILIAVPTPSSESGAVDLSFVRTAALSLGRALAQVSGWRSFVVKSTVVPGSADSVVAPALEEASGRDRGRDFGVGSNPEFLAEGTLVKDALEPSRIVLGVAEPRTEALLRDAYQGFPSPIVVLPVASAELVKYASNALLATKVSFANEIARFAEVLGADVYPVMEAVGLDPRLGPHFLRAGPGFGGSCFTKDLKALLATARDRSVALPVVQAVLEVNEGQARHVVDLAEKAAGPLAGRDVALLGLAFKAGTGDVRESRAYPILGELLKRGASLRLHDPQAGPAFIAGLPPLPASAVGDRVRLADTLEEALTGVDLAIIQVDWSEYRQAPAATWRRLKGKTLLDTRRSVDPEVLRQAGVRYAAVGRGSA